MRYLGIDYGLKKMGLAVSEGTLAAPLRVVSLNSLKDALEKARRVIKEQAIDEVIVGVPESGVSLKATKNFIKALQAVISVRQVEETLSSYNARALMRDLAISKKGEDAYAACLILQNYLDSLNLKNG